MGHTQQTFGHLDRNGGKDPDRGQAVGLPGINHQGIERQGGVHGADTMGRPGSALAEGRGVDPADHAVTTGPAPQALALPVQNVEGLTEDQLIDRFVTCRCLSMEVCDPDPAIHRSNSPECRGPDEPLQCLFGQIGPGEGETDIKGGGGGGQSWAGPVKPPE